MWLFRLPEDGCFALATVNFLAAILIFTLLFPSHGFRINKALVEVMNIKRIMSLLLCGWLDRIKGTFGHMTEKHSFTMLDDNSSLSNTKNRKCRFERYGEEGGTAKKPDASVVISVSASQDFTYRPSQPEP